ncbi:MAG: AI-2E family transporter [Minisyncoccia bacterium]
MEKESKISLNITTGTIIKIILVILGFWFIFFIKDLILVVIVAIVLASGLEPFISLFGRYKIARLPAAIITYLGLFAVFAGLFYFFIPSVLKETSSFLNSLPKYLESATLWNPSGASSEIITKSQQVVDNISGGLANPSSLVSGLGATISNNVTSQAVLNSPFGLKDLIQMVQQLASGASDNFVKMISIIFGGLFSFVLIVVLSFYFVVREDGVADFLCLISPESKEKYIVGLWKRSQKKIAYWMQGQLVLMLVISVLVYLGLTILGVKNALMLALLAGVLEIIPLFGPVLASIPAILSAFVDGGVTAALIVVGLYIILQQFENHLIYPLVVKKIVGVSPILVILSLIIGAKLAGFLGIILSVPIVSAVMEFVEDIEKRKKTPMPSILSGEDSLK